MKDVAYRRIGHIVKPHGIVGRMKVRLQVDAPSDCWETKKVWLQLEEAQELVCFHVCAFYETVPGFALLALDEVRDRDQAGLLRAQGLYIVPMPGDQPGHPSDDLQAFVSYRLYDEDSFVGIIKRIYYPHIQNPLFVLETEDGKERFVPAQPAFMRQIDTDKRILCMELPEGLLALP